jgi:hypothetical protein
MKQFKFWGTVLIDGVPQRKEFVFTAASWTEARRMMSVAMKQFDTA